MRRNFARALGGAMRYCYLLLVCVAAFGVASIASAATPAREGTTMSWGQTTRCGSAHEVVQATYAWGPNVARADAQFGASDTVTNGHAAQIAAAQLAIREAVHALVLPPGYDFTVSAGGHAANDGTGFVSVHVGMSKRPLAVSPPEARSEAVHERATSSTDDSTPAINDR